LQNHRCCSTSVYRRLDSISIGGFVGDVLTEVSGYAETRKVIWTGLASLVLLAVMVSIRGALPADPLWHNKAAYVSILGAVPRVAAASLIAYFVGEFSNSYVLAKYKIRTVGKRMSGRTIEELLVDALIQEAFIGKNRMAALAYVFDRLEGTPRRQIDLKNVTEDLTHPHG
jgi:hypothetical protein